MNQSQASRPSGIRGGLAVLAAMVVVYLSVPGHPELSTRGFPLGPAGTVAASAVILLAAVFRRAYVKGKVLAGSVALIAVLIAARLAIGVAATPLGWTARYYANDHWAGAPEWSSDFRSLGATRIDRRISFKDDTFPAHYLNNYAFDRGIRREVSEPMSVEWNGFAFVDTATTERVSLTARGDASLRVDGQVLIDVSSAPGSRPAETVLALTPGVHALTVRYHKPADTDGLIELKTSPGDVVTNRSTSLVVTPIATDRAASASPSRLLALGRIVDLAALATFACVVLHAVGTTWTSQIVPLTVYALFAAHGWWQARPFAERVVALTARDDWWGFESSARDILHYGPLMTLGKPMGEAAAYFFHPFYCYFLAAVHGITGESLFGPVFVQFLILAVVALMVWRLAAELFGDLPALAGLAALVLIFELDFARYYTVTLLSENLYILTVTLTVVPFVRWVRRGERADLLRIAFWGGVSTITRPPMMLYLLPALALVAFISAKRTRRLTTSLLSVGLVAVVWLAVVAPVTARNVIVAHRFVVISDFGGSALIYFNMPASVSAAQYGDRFRGTVGSGLKIVAQIAWDHPLAMLGVQARKLGFSLGMIHWAGGYRPHPELIAVTMLYVAMCIVFQPMRQRALWPIHLFVLAHLASMPLTLPWNYGYRMILPPFVYTSALSVAAACSFVATRWAGFGREEPAGSLV